MDGYWLSRLSCCYEILFFSNWLFVKDYTFIMLRLWWQITRPRLDVDGALHDDSGYF